MADAYRPDQTNICGNLDHNTDGDPSVPPSQYQNGDAEAASHGVCAAYVPNATDDTYDYSASGFDFNHIINQYSLK